MLMYYSFLSQPYLRLRSPTGPQKTIVHQHKRTLIIILRNKPLYDEYVLIIYSVQREVPKYKNVLVTFNSLCDIHVTVCL
jgi:hypothetical protein